MALDRNQAELIANFFLETIEKSVSGNSTNFAETHDPSEARFRALFNSIPFLAEANARAKIDSIAAIKQKAGLVTIATDEEAKANEEGLKVDRTTVPTSKHLPTVKATEEQTIEGNFQADFVNIALNVEIDPSVTTRNSFLVALSAEFIAFLNGITSQVDINIDNIQANADAIAGLGGGMGETNTASNTGTGEDIFKEKVGADLVFKGLTSDDIYTIVTARANDIGIQIDEAALLAYMQANLIFPAASVETVSNIGGQYEVFKQITGTDIELRTIEADAGILITQTANTLQIRIDATYIQGLILTQIDGTMSNQGSAKSYLFSAQSIADQVINEGSKIVFKDDSSAGFYDYDNTWTVSQWVANEQAGIDNDLIFNAFIEVELIEDAATTAETIGFELKHITADGVTTTILNTQNVVIPSSSGYLAGHKFYLNFIDIKPSTSTISIEEGDRIFITCRRTAGTGSNLSSNNLKINSGSFIYNGEV